MSLETNHLDFITKLYRRLKKIRIELTFDNLDSNWINIIKINGIKIREEHGGIPILYGYTVSLSGCIAWYIPPFAIRMMFQYIREIIKYEKYVEIVENTN